MLSPSSTNVLGCITDLRCNQLVTMASAQKLLQCHRDLLLEWLSPNPAPLLRWLWDVGVLSRDQYLTLLERLPANAAAAALETVCASEASSQGFLKVLGEVQDYYCAQLQAWVQQNVKLDHTDGLVTERTPVRVEGRANTKYSYCSFLTCSICKTGVLFYCVRN